jgi:hypothetical protein
MNEARNTGAWGQLELGMGESFVSNVVDSGGLRQKRIILTYNTESGSGSLYYRFSNTPFNQDDMLPNWVLYTVPVVGDFRYYQIRVSGV